MDERDIHMWVSYIMKKELYREGGKINIKGQLHNGGEIHTWGMEGGGGKKLHTEGRYT